MSATTTAIVPFFSPEQSPDAARAQLSNATLKEVIHNSCDGESSINQQLEIRVTSDPKYFTSVHTTIA